MVFVTYENNSGERSIILAVIKMENRPKYSLRQLIFYSLKLGYSGFGGPVALVGAVIIIASRSIIDIPTAIIAFASVTGLIYLKKLKEPYIILIAALIGILLNLS
jgi:chromate transport protein ChrA